MNSKPSSPSSIARADHPARPAATVATVAGRTTAGVTLAEVLVALAIAGLLVAAASTTAVLAQRVVTAERVRTELNQNLRTALDLVGADVRIAGERMSPRSELGLRAVEVRPGELILRRNLLETTLAMCDPSPLPAGGPRGEVTVALDPDASPPPAAECAALDGDGDGAPDALQRWRDFRLARGGEVPVFIVKPNGDGEFFRYASEDLDRRTIRAAGGHWLHRYEDDDLPTLIALEQRRYYLEDGDLLLEIVGDGRPPRKLVPDVAAFEVSVTLRATESEAARTVDRYDASVPRDWNDIEAVNLAVTGRVDINGRTFSRTLRTSFLPRNALSN